MHKKDTETIQERQNMNGYMEVQKTDQLIM